MPDGLAGSDRPSSARGWRDARILAVVASVVVGTVYALPAILPRWIPEHEPGPLEMPCPAASPGAINLSGPCHPGVIVPASWSSWPAFDPFDLLVRTVVIMVGSFVVLATIRWAWRSFR